MWINYFSYRYCIVDDTLFIEGVSEDNLVDTAYSLPIGTLPLSASLELLRAHCRIKDHRLRLSAIPEDHLHLLCDTDISAITELNDWSDYIYDAHALATLSGNALKKKRNHVNRFLADNPCTELQPLTIADIQELKAFLTQVTSEQHQSQLAKTELTQTCKILDNWSSYSSVFIGAILRDSTKRVVAFTIGEIIGDTLFVHIEKMDHDVTGAGETVNKLFAEHILSKRPDVHYINREEDVGNSGIRMAKLSYHPSLILKKYNIVFND
jgi:hypothetical protein